MHIRNSEYAQDAQSRQASPARVVEWSRAKCDLAATGGCPFARDCTIKRIKDESKANGWYYRGAKCGGKRMGWRCTTRTGITLTTVGLTWCWFRPTVTTTCTGRHTDTCTARKRSRCSRSLWRSVITGYSAKEPAVFHPVVQRIVSPADQQNHMVNL